MIITQITRDELMNLVNLGEKFKLVDVLSRESFEKEHIKGAIPLPLEEIGQRAHEMLDKSDKIVVYCASFECMASTRAAEKLMSMGYERVLDFKGGIKDYKEGHLPLEGAVHEKESIPCPSCAAR